jgi:hypothetical protein
VDPVGGTTSYLLTQGVLGIACIILGLVVNKLYNKNERLQAEKDALTKEMVAIIEARRIEDKATTTEVLTVLSNNTQTNRILAEKIEAGKSNGGQ